MFPRWLEPTVEKTCPSCGYKRNAKMDSDTHCPTCKAEYPKDKKQLPLSYQVGLGLVLGIIIAWWLFVPSTKREAAPPISATKTELPRPAQREAAIEVSARKLSADYNANEVAADQKYKDKTLKVTGIVTSVNKDDLGLIFISMATRNKYLPVKAYLQSDQSSEAAGLSRDWSVTVNCIGRGTSIGSPILGNCDIACINQRPRFYEDSGDPTC